MRSRIACLAVLLTGDLACRRQEPPGRYLYVVTCDARVDRLDTASGRKTDSYELAQRTANQRLIPPVQGTLDGCLAYDTVFDSKASIFYTIVPIEATAKPDGTKDYRMLGFSIPGVELVKTLPAGQHLDEPPTLEIADGAGAHIVQPSHGPPQTAMDLSTFTPDRQPVHNQILETSGAGVLLRIFTADLSELVLAVADRHSKTLARLQNVVSTATPNVHLAPGGSAVLVEETAQNESRAAKNGKLALYDARTGKRIREFSDPHVEKLYLLAIAPNGKVIYHSGETYWFLDLQRTFASERVTRATPAGYPDMFFADR